VKSKVCLVTGATNGIGKAIAAQLASSGATVFIHGRNPDKTERTRAELVSSSGNGNICALLADFASLTQVHALACQMRAHGDRLHVLANNVGVLTDRRQLSHDGFELTFAVNHLAPFLLTQALLPKLVTSAPAGISFNSSSAMGSAAVRFEDLQMEQHFDGWTAYANTKLANFWVSNLLAEKLAGTGVVSNAYCPGLVDTDLLTGNRDFGAARIARLRRQMRAPAQGAVTPVFLATSDEAAGINGAFFLQTHGFGTAPLRLSWDRNAAERLWAISETLVADWLD